MSFDSDALDRRDPSLIERVLPWLEAFVSRYFRLRVDGLENIPGGPAMFVGNHNGGIAGPDLLCTLAVLWRQLGAATPLYALAHDFAMRQLTPLGRVLQPFGALRASSANARRVLDAGGRVLVYPGGDLEAYRHFSRRDEIIILPRTGFIDVARQTNVPIVPIVAIGAHRSALIFSEGQAIARWLRLARWGRLRRFPLALALPWVIAPGPWLPYLPLPFRIHLQILPPITIGPGPAEEIALHVQTTMQQALDESMTP